jgi:DNA sulfur modification protein DndD
MLVDWLELDNFECYYTPQGSDPQRLEFSFSGKGRNLTFFVARNNSGKTTIIRALRFLFYGKVDEMQVVNNKALSEIGVGEELTIAVRAKVQFDYPQGPKPVTLERKIVAKRLADVEGHLRVRECSRSMALTRRETASRNKDFHGLEATEMVKEQLPEELFPFYFLDGENLKNRLGLGGQSFDKSMLNSIHGSLYYSLFEKAEIICSKAQQNINRELSKLTKKSREMEEIQGECDQAKRRESTSRDSCKKQSAEFDKSNEEYKRLEDRYIELLKSESQSAKDELEKSQQQERALLKDKQRYEDNIQEKLSEVLPYAFMERAGSIADKVISSLHDRNIFPVNITEDLITELIDQQKCICGSSLVKGSAGLKTLEAYREQAIRQNMDEDLREVRSVVSKGSDFGGSALARLQKSRSGLEKDLAAYNEKATHLLKCQDHIRRMDRKVEQGHDSALRDCLLQRNRARDKKDELQRIVQRLELDITRWKAELQRAEARYAKIAPAGGKVEQLLALNSNLKRVGELIERSKKEIQNEIKSRLERHTEDIYEKISTDNSYAIIQPNLLPGIRNEGQKQNQGGGQKKVLTMAYMVGLANVRKEICSELRKHFYLKVTGDQCFFMDSIYSDMDIEYQRNVTEILPTFVKQLLILVAPQNCTEAVQEKLAGHVTAIYKALHYTSKVRGDDPKTVNLWGNTVNLVESLQDGLAYSQLEKLEVK